jgi:signal transduction histidine kinase
VTEPAGDAAAVRRVRLRLLLWSGGSTFVVLVALGWLLYAAVANSLQAAALDQLRDRARSIAAVIETRPFGLAPDPGIFTATPAAPGFVFGGETSGTLAVVYAPNGTIMGEPKLSQVLPNSADVTTAIQTGQTIVSEVNAIGSQFRVLTVSAESPVGTWAVQVVGDRSAEVRTLGVLLTVLVAGGLVALAASLGVGWMYADRALVPIRDSLRRQREFAADASHELRTPLAIVKGSIGHLRKHQDEPATSVGTALDDIEAGTDRLAALVDDLLLLARTDSGAVQLESTRTDLGDIALEATGSLGALAKANGVELQIDAEPVALDGDAGRLRQLVVLLVDNAISHSAAAGGSRVDIRIQAADGRAILTVDDDGRGIRPEDLDRVFDRFWRAPDAPDGGTGLGLAIARWIVERHGGTITAANRTSGGARFEVRLPRVVGAQHPA